VQPHVVDQPGLAQLAPQHGGGERRRIDRAAQLRPEMRHRAEMILMRVGDHQAQQLVPPLDQEPRIGHHDLDLGILAAAEADAAVNREPLALAPVQVEVHADFARPAEGQEG
jgi:hypothetical protein